MVEQEDDTRRHISGGMTRGIASETRKGFCLARLRHQKVGVRGGTAKLLYRGLFSLAMKVSSGSRNLAFWALLLIVLFLATGCTSGLERDLAAKPDESLGGRWWFSNPCGWLAVRRPLFNVTGRLTASARPGSAVSLFVAPNGSFESVMWALENCPPIGKVAVVDGRFSVAYLPVGKYFVALPRGFLGDVQGFPIVEEFNTSSYSVRVLWHGGDPRHSLCAFAVEKRNLSAKRSLS